jgi:hypothetical protein
MSPFKRGYIVRWLWKILKIIHSSLVWWCSSAVLALGRQRQEDHEFEVSLGCTVRP